ncbi:MAG: hypothetical protein JNG50_03695 [Mogibacterium sp.]|uniref:hypothetical protein n=1 Tax=Mogibacterium sp. TaxID=2049035 RepID=UPI001A41DBB0|nr:hypothetical protein [Mogibacterium sp.]MBL6468583.1 hypothetical protein [Mogibacterium sp.]
MFKKKMRRKTSLLLVLVVACMAFMTACGKSGESGGKAEKIELSDKKETVSVARPGLDIKIANIVRMW